MSDKSCTIIYSLSKLDCAMHTKHKLHNTTHVEVQTVLVVTQLKIVSTFATQWTDHDQQSDPRKPLPKRPEEVSQLHLW